MRSVLLAAIAAAAVMTAPAVAQERPLRVVMIDVEGGAATLFVTPEGKSMLVDTGWPTGLGGPRPVAGAAPAPPAPTSADRITAAMAKLGLRKLDYVLITHYHTDHVGGVSNLLARVPVDTFIDHGPNREQLRPGQPSDYAAVARHPVGMYQRYENLISGHDRRIVKPGDRLRIGSMTVDIVASDGEFITRPLPGAGGRTPHCDAVADKAEDDGENGRSIGFVASFGRARVLDLADITWNQEKALVCPVNKLGRMDLVVVSHHGSEFSNTPALIAATAARVAVMQNGARKGGDKSILDNYARYAPSTVVWQQHAATRAADANRPADYVANLDVTPDAAHSIVVDVFRDGRMRVTNERHGFTRAYGPR